MNERIRELIKQASGIGHDDDGDELTPALVGKGVEKFAKLIVKECEKVAKGGSWYYDAPSCGWRNPINHVCNVMKEHFGVEE